MLHTPDGSGPRKLLLNSPNMGATYRKKRDGDTWHFCSNCSEWPTSNYDEQEPPPLSGPLCNECKVKRREKNCRQMSPGRGGWQLNN